MRALPFLFAWLIPLTALAGVVLGGAWTFATTVLLFVLTPLLDQRVVTGNPAPEEEEALRGARAFDLVLWGWAPLQIGVTLFALHHLVTGGPSPLEVLGMVTSVGFTAGAGINVAHELMHRKGRFERALAEVLTTLASYTHFCVEHVHGHHRNVATPLDPATSRLGESVYAFIPRSVVGGVRSFWRIESRLAERRGARGLRDRRVRYPLALALVYAAVAAAFGAAGLLFFVAQGAIGFVQLEVINYLEHYGMQRRELAPGKYERTRPQHSWNSPHRLSALYLFNLPRHADHHYLASRPYPILRHHEDAPQLPAGYGSMFLLALVPPLWHRVMDPRVRALRGPDAPAEHEGVARGERVVRA